MRISCLVGFHYALQLGTLSVSERVHARSLLAHLSTRESFGYFPLTMISDIRSVDNHVVIEWFVLQPIDKCLHQIVREVAGTSEGEYR